MKAIPAGGLLRITYGGDYCHDTLSTPGGQHHNAALSDIVAGLQVEISKAQAKNHPAVGREHEERKAKSDSELEMELKALETESLEGSVGMSHLHVRVFQLKDDLENERSTLKDLREKLVRSEIDTTELINQLKAQLIIQSTALIGLEEKIIALKEDVSREQANFETATNASKENLEGERNRVR
ncbi:hypothetical protein AXG93_399s1100 [Marchantia polymorpha subsp. ruderalis]|uniref:Uncharacterized protein n=1 Tax=Marchantia polymorpha subsp. ruderalis TaxID=1480154 RepID=A0A176WKQ5_MARPO|nr:hypothetical protein AXG93_399s1100 [Marchantia polymorpha subsp. ruderalis]